MARRKAEWAYPLAPRAWAAAKLRAASQPHEAASHLHRAASPALAVSLAVAERDWVGLRRAQAALAQAQPAKTGKAERGCAVSRLVAPMFSRAPSVRTSAFWPAATPWRSTAAARAARPASMARASRVSLRPIPAPTQWRAAS